MDIGLVAIETGRAEGIVNMEFGRARGGAFQLRMVVGFDDNGFITGLEDNGPGTMGVAASDGTAVSVAEDFSGPRIREASILIRAADDIPPGEVGSHVGVRLTSTLRRLFAVAVFRLRSTLRRWFDNGARFISMLRL